MLKNLESADLEAVESDFFVAALGYESRATAIAQLISPRATKSICVGFDHNQAFAYESNSAWFQRNDFEVFAFVPPTQFSTVLEKAVVTAAAGVIGRPMRVTVDISSFDRFRLACLVEVFERLGQDFPLIVDFWYSIAAFEPPVASLGRNEVAGPVHRRFAGRFLEPGRPLALVAGLGYELGKVVGVTEYLQASRVVALFPDSPIAEYEDEVRRANQTLLEDLQPQEVISYRVDDPRRTIATLDAAIRGLEATYNVVLFPGGPKIFVLGCLLAQRANPSSAVWRVSSGASIRPRDSAPSGVRVGLRWAVPQDASAS